MEFKGGRGSWKLKLDGVYGIGGENNEVSGIGLHPFPFLQTDKVHAYRPKCK